MAASAIIEGKAPLAVVRGEFFCGKCHARSVPRGRFMPFWNLRMAVWQTKWQMMKTVWQRISSNLSDNLYDIGEDFKEFFVDAVSSLPYLGLALGFILPVAETGDARRLFKNLPAVGRLGRDNFGNASLTDDGKI